MLYIDLNKGKLNTGKLVKKPVLVRKQDGKTHIRNQWVDPTTGLAKDDSKKAKMNEAERWSTGKEKSTPRNKVKMYRTAHNISIQSTNQKPDSVDVSEDSSTAFINKEMKPTLTKKPKLSHHKVTDSEGTERTLFWNTNLEGLFPHEVDENGDILDEVLQERLGNVYPAPLSIRNYDTGLSEYEIDERCGMIGAIDMDNSHVGTRYKDWDVYNEFLDNLQAMNEEGWYDEEIDIDIYKETWSNLFGNYSVETLQSALAGEHGSIINIEPRGMVGLDGYHGLTLTMDLSNDKGEHIGSCMRTFHRDKMGTIHQVNDELDIKEQYQNSGVAKDLYSRQMQLLKHMSRGHAAYNHLTANISVGKYAWAGKGYDFKNQEELDGARDRLSKFCKAQGMDTNTLLNECGYNSINDLKHSWQFASLDNGKKYTLSDKKYTNIKGEGHFGKSFMLGGMSMWEGVLAINTGSLGEKLSKKNMK